ncbi:MAG: glycine betaine ABC transporter substrate-binding protein [Tetrasphaera sp.]
MTSTSTRNTLLLGCRRCSRTRRATTAPGPFSTRCRAGYEAQFQATWLAASPFNDTNAFATTQAIADQYGLKTYSDVAANAANLRLGGPAEFPDRVDTQGLDEAYGGFLANFKEFKPLGTGTLRYDALQSGDVNLIVAFGTDEPHQGRQPGAAAG